MTSASLQLMAAFGDWSPKPSPYAAEAAELSADYRAFVRKFWPVLSPAPLVEDYDTDALIEHAVAFYGRQRQSSHLLIHIQPGSAKTLLLAVMPNAWRWTWDPAYRLLSASHAGKYKEHSTETRKLVRSAEFQKFWPLKTEEASDRADHFVLDSLGHRTAVNFTAKLEGAGGDDQVADDVQVSADQYSPQMLKRHFDIYVGPWSDRLRDKSTGGQLVVGQRLGPFDLYNAIRLHYRNKYDCLALEGVRTFVAMATYYRTSGGQVERIEMPMVDTALSRSGAWVDRRTQGEALTSRTPAEYILALPEAVRAARHQQRPVMASTEGAKFRNFNRAVHLRSFAEKMGQPDLVAAIAEALRRGWEVGVGIDHGLDGGREVAYVSLAHQKLQEVWTVGSYRNAKRTTPLEDAMGIRAELDRLGIPIRRVVRARGDIGNLGKGSAGGAAGSINAALTAAVYPKGHPKQGLPVLGFSVVTAVKRSVEEDVENVNIALASGGVFVDESQEVLAVALENWSEGEAYKDDCDAWRYDVSPIVRPWLISGRTA